MKRSSIALLLGALGALGALVAFAMIRGTPKVGHERPGKITIKPSAPSAGASVEISWDAGGERPGRFPTVASVPFGAIVDVKATHPKFPPYQQEIVLFPDQPETVVTIALEEIAVTFTAGFRESELPSAEQVRFRPELGKTREEAPDPIFERVGTGCLIVDRDAIVWRCRAAGSVRKWEYWQVGRVDRVQLGRMMALVEPALRSGFSERDGCRDCDGFVINAYRPAQGGGALELAHGGGRVGARQNPEARLLVGWFLALCRDAPAYDPSSPRTRSSP